MVCSDLLRSILLIANLSESQWNRNFDLLLIFQHIKTLLCSWNTEKWYKRAQPRITSKSQSISYCWTTNACHVWLKNFRLLYFHRNYSFLNLEIVENSKSCCTFQLINWLFAAESIQGRKLFKGGNFKGKYSM